MKVAITGRSAGQNKQAQKREQLRDTLWPDSGSNVWNRKENKGFTTIPRLLSIVMALISELSPQRDPSKVYFELWTRAFDEGLVTVSDESEHAFCAGYTGNRAVRTWKERVLTLIELGFIKAMPHGNREYGHILLLDPLRVCCELRKSGKFKVTDEWWSVFVRRAGEIGATIGESS